MIDRQHILMFVTENRQKLHPYDQIAGGGVFEVLMLLLTQRFLTFRCVPCVKIKNTDIVLPGQEGPQLP